MLKDVGLYLKDELKKAFKEADVKYIDPTYMIRAITTTAIDRIYCKVLAHNAVHAAFAGFTGITVGLVNTNYVYLPIPAVISIPRKVRLVRCCAGLCIADVLVVVTSCHYCSTAAGLQLTAEARHSHS